MKPPVALCGSLVLMLAGISTAAAPPEFRAAWVTRFEWPSADPEKCKANIVEVFETLAAANCNAAIFQIRGEADTLYPSELEPWSPLIGEKDPGFDPLAFAIEQAHQRGIQLHAYVNPMPLRALSWKSPPKDPRHLFHKHGPDGPEPWVCVDDQGKPAREEYYYFSPGIPEVHAHIRRVVMDVLRRYDVDGIHLDRIRYPGARYSHDPASRRRFITANPELLDWPDWQRSQINKLVNDLAAEVRAEKPNLPISCSAWGIYNRYNIPGYSGFSSGFHDFYQDTWAWCRLGAMDFLVPMIYWNLPNPKPNYDEVLRDFVSGVGSDRVVGGQMVFSPDENEQQVQVSRELKAFGSAFYNYRSARRRGVFERVARTLYAEKAPVPVPARVATPKTGAILGTVVDGAGEPLVDAAVSIRPVGGGSRREGVFNRSWTSSADGRFAFLEVPPGAVQVVARFPGVPDVISEPLNVTAGQTARVSVTVPVTPELRQVPYLAILRPGENAETSSPVVHILGRTMPGNTVTVGGSIVEVFSTGGFARDNIALEPGENRIEVTVVQDGRSHTRTLTIRRTEPAATQPTVARADTQPSEARPADAERSQDIVGRIAETTAERTGITHGLHSVRLGGPWLAWVPKGTRLEVIARQGRNYQVRLSASMTGWVDRDDVRLLPEGTPVPHNYFTACEVSGDDRYDTVSLSMAAPIAVSVQSEAAPNRLYIDFYNTHDAATWISHKTGARIIGPVRVDQIETDRVRVTVPINTRQIWGYWTEIADGRFKLYVRRPPTIASPPDSPLKGLTVAVEAGHGGSSNHGARGLFGTKEKDVNLAGALALERELKARGARVVQVRRGDESVSLGERVERANAANADLFVAIHANSAGSSRGYLSVSGTSTYYHDIHCQPIARLVYERLLGLGWREFGVVGSFSYTPLRNTRIPSILVEQAFMSHPGDEARLTDPAYQREQAVAIAEGLEAFLRTARE